MEASQSQLENGEGTTEKSFEPASLRFLRPERIERIGKLVAPLLEHDLSWIERRKESVEILDDTAVQRQISVDFSLREWVEPLLRKERGDLGDLFVAPLFVLPKSPPSSLMNFDLSDADGHSLWLISREDNARISAATLTAMARRLLKSDSLPAKLEDQLTKLCKADPATGEEIAARLLTPSGDDSTELAELRENKRFSWWVRTFAHSSIIVVLFRSPIQRRMLIKLRYQERIKAKQRVLTRLGWAAYRVGIDCSLFEARSSHFEAEAPPGLRILEARLSDNHSLEPTAERGFLRRVHLYRPQAHAVNAATAVLWLVVSGGFLGGALLAATLGFGALVSCAVAAEDIAKNPTSAPAILLVIPGLIASYIARPDQHALTARLLSFARRLLLVSALCAYGAAAKVALAGGAPDGKAQLDARTDQLRTWLIVLAAISLIPLLGLLIGFLRGRVRRPTFGGRRFTNSVCLRGTHDHLLERLAQGDLREPLLSRYSLDTRSPESVRFYSLRWHGTWFLRLNAEPLGSETLLRLTGDYVPRLPRLSLAWIHRWSESRHIKAELNSLDGRI